jgi:hypothetical protein
MKRGGGVLGVALAAAAAAALAPAHAFAWECLTDPYYTGGPFGCSPTACRMQPGNSLTYHVVVDKFKADEISAIDQAAGAWRAGANQINRGASWQFVRGSDWAVGTVDITDNDNGITKEDDTWMTDNGVPATAIAVTFPHYGAWPSCGVKGADILFRSSEPWTSDLPAVAAYGDESIGQVAIHELGHVIGFDHSDDVLATMNSQYPAGGDISGSYRISEVDYVGLASSYPDSSTGKNLMLSKFLPRSGGIGKADEGWDHGEPPAYHAGDTLDKPEDLSVILTGTTGTLNDVKLRWYLRPSGGTCGDAGSLVLGTKGLTLGVNTPFSTGLSSYVVPASTPAGKYRMCAKLDPDDAFSEISESDNAVQSDTLYEIN